MESYNRYSSQGHDTRPSSLPKNHQQEELASYGLPRRGLSRPYGNSFSAPGFGSYFPPGTHPDVIRSFLLVDKDESGFIDEKELQAALSLSYQKFRLRTVQLLMHLFKNPMEDCLRIGPNEVSALWKCLGQWRAIFERFDRDHSGNIDTMELRDALNSIGYAVPPSVLQLLVSKYEDGTGRSGALSFDSFVECGMIIKGLTDTFKELDPHCTGSATLRYGTFLSMVIPFILPY